MQKTSPNAHPIGWRFLMRPIAAFMCLCFLIGCDVNRLRYHSAVNEPLTSNLSSDGLVNYVHRPYWFQPAPLLSGMKVQGDLTLSSNSLDVFPPCVQVHFTKEVKIVAIKATVPLDFCDCKFCEHVSIAHSRFSENVRFYHCEFKKGLELVDDQFQSLDLSNTKTTGCPGQIDCVGCTFKTLKGSAQEPCAPPFENVLFKDCRFTECDLSGLGCAKLSIVHSNCTALDCSGVNCDQCIELQNDKIGKASFNAANCGEISIADIQFGNNVNFDSLHVQSLKLSRVSFTGDVEIRGDILYGAALTNVRFESDSTFDLETASGGPTSPLLSLKNVTFSGATKINKESIEALAVQDSRTWISLKSALFRSGNFRDLLAVQRLWQKSANIAGVAMAASPPASRQSLPPQDNPPQRNDQHPEVRRPREGSTKPAVADLGSSPPAGAVLASTVETKFQNAWTMILQTPLFVENVFNHLQTIVIVSVSVFAILMLLSVFIRLVRPADTIFLFPQPSDGVSGLVSGAGSAIHWLVYQSLSLALATVNTFFWVSLLAVLLFGVLIAALFTIPPDVVFLN